MKIGFFGDSFCSEISNPHSLIKNYQTYILKIKNFYSAEIVNYGIGGSSVWDIILNQFPPFIDTTPEICIFCWTDYNRLYNKKVRNMTLNSIQNKKMKDYKLNDLFNYKIVSAAKHYFEYLHDPIKSRVETIAALQYFDKNFLSKINSTIIHLWSFEKYYNWSNGISIDIPLHSFVQGSHMAANHIDGDEHNHAVFELIQKAIDDHHRPS